MAAMGVLICPILGFRGPGGNGPPVLVESREQILIVPFDSVRRFRQGRQALAELRHRPPQGLVLLPIL